MSSKVSKGLFDGAWFIEVVGVQPSDHLTTGLARGFVDGFRRTAVRYGGPPDARVPIGIVTQDVQGAIRRCPVDDNQFEIRVRLSQNAVQGFPQEACLIQQRHEDGNLRLPAHLEIGWVFILLLACGCGLLMGKAAHDSNVAVCLHGALLTLEDFMLWDAPEQHWQVGNIFGSKLQYNFVPIDLWQ